MAKIIDGKAIAERINNETRIAVSQMKVTPKLGIILASNDEPSHTYVILKMRKAKELGIETKLYHFPESILKDQLIHEIKRLRNNDAITGALIQLPLYDHLKSVTKEVVNAIIPEKDIDGLTSVQQGAASHFLEGAFLPATVEAILECFNEIFDEDLSWQNIIRTHTIIHTFKGRNILIVNNSDLIGKPLAMILTSLGATVTIANNETTNLRDLTSQADTIISATGKTNLIDGSMIKENTILIDVTSEKVGNEIKGDFIISDELLNKALYYTPVPGGVGPITIACLLRNLVRETGI